MNPVVYVSNMNQPNGIICSKKRELHLKGKLDNLGLDLTLSEDALNEKQLKTNGFQKSDKFL